MAMKTVGKDFKDLVNTNENGELQYDTDIVPEEVKSPGTAHQPVLNAFDLSGSMAGDAGTGINKHEECCRQYNELPNSKAFQSLSAVDRNAVDMLTLSFGGDGIKVETPWTPLSLFEGITPSSPNGGTPFYELLINAIEATRVIRHHYAETGIECLRPLVNIYTDGAATDYTMREKAKEMCRKYASKDAGKVKIFVILVPGAMTDKQIEDVAKDIMDLCDNITVIKAVDCVNGLPAAFEFLAASAVVGVSSAVGEEMKIKYDPNYLKVAPGTKVEGGQMSIGPQITWQ